MSFAVLYNLLPEKVCRGWWNRQWKQSRVLWRLDGEHWQNVQESLQLDTNDMSAVLLVLKRIGTLPDDLDGVVKFVMSKFQQQYNMSIPVRLGGCYATDSELHGTMDFWQKPSQTFALGQGDCDDWGIFLYALLRAAGVPAWRLKCMVTQVIQNGKDAGYHFDIIYLAMTDYEWYTLEGTWYPTVAINRYLNKPRKESTDLYGTILFTFNEEYVWAQHNLTVKPLFLHEEELVGSL